MTETIANPHPNDRAKSPLSPGYKLHWYQIKAVLGRGGFGITYLADDLNLQKQVAIKEYFPTDFAHRESGATVVPSSDGTRSTYEWGLDRFVAEARTLSKFDHPNIVKVHAVFEENGTGYMVMSYEDGRSLQSLLDKDQTLDEASLLAIVRPLLSGLQLVHEHSFIHRDIKPDNIFIRTDGTPALLDFGSARQSLAGETADLTVLVTPGYAPVEQYFSKSDTQGPWTDIYGLGATLYRAVTGELLTNAVERSHTEQSGSGDVRSGTEQSTTLLAQSDYSPQFLNAIDHAIAVDAAARPQTVMQWLAELPETAQLAAHRVKGDSSAPTSNRALVLGSVAAALVVALAGYAYFKSLSLGASETGTQFAVESTKPEPVLESAAVTDALPTEPPTLELEQPVPQESDLAAAQRLEQARLDLVAEQEAIDKRRQLDERASAQKAERDAERAAERAAEKQRAEKAALQLNAKIQASTAIIATRAAKVPDELEYLESTAHTDLTDLKDRRLTTTVLATTNEWQDSGVMLIRGRTYKIQATGSWKMAGICRQSDASGEGIYRRLCIDLNLEIIKRYSLGALIAKVGRQPLPFYVGTEFLFAANEDAPLFLRSNDGANGTRDNSGELQVTVELID